MKETIQSILRGALTISQVLMLVCNDFQLEKIRRGVMTSMEGDSNTSAVFLLYAFITKANILISYKVINVCAEVTITLSPNKFSALSLTFLLLAYLHLYHHHLPSLFQILTNAMRRQSSLIILCGIMTMSQHQYQQGI